MPSPSLVLLRTQSDARLVALARDAHERAFEAIVERYRRQLLRSCRRVLPEGRAEDALQQTLMAAWRGLERGDEVRELRPWLHRIAHNTSLNLLRQTGYDYDELQESLRIADAPDDELERRAVVRQTLHGLASLPPRQRDALLAIAVEGRSQEEVAGELGLSPGAVRQLVHRARSALRAAATAVVPLPLVSWIAGWGSRGELATRIAELSAGAGGASAAAALAKAGTVAVIAGGAVAGPALIEKRTTGPAPPAAAVAAPRDARTPVTASASEAAATPEPRPVAPRERASSRRTAATAPAREHAGRRDRDDDEDEPDRPRSGPSEDEPDGADDEDRSGPSGGDDEDRSGPSGDDGDDRSGPSAGDEPEDRSGPSHGEGLSETGGGSSGPSLRSGSSGSSGSGGGAQPTELATSEPAEERDSSGSGSGGDGELDDD